MAEHTPAAALRAAFETDDVSTVERLVRADPQLLRIGNSRPAVTLARSVAMAEKVLSLGADAGSVGRWWAPGFGTREVHPAVARFLVARGASLSAHAAAGLGLMDLLAGMLDADPTLVHAKGGDGCTPLHFSRDCATAQLLLARGARVDARDDDHDSTPAQWLIGDAPEVARWLLDHGAAPDIFLATALGDRALVEEVIGRDRGRLAHRIGKAPGFPPLGQGRGGTIYQWSLGFNSYPHQIALSKGHQALFDYLFEASDTVTRFLVSCLLARRPEAEAIAASNPGLVGSLPSVDLELLARYCWETNLNYEAVRLMLDLGFPVAHPETSHGYTPLHNAAWAGAAPLVDLLLERGHPVDIVDPRFHATPLGFALHDCLVEKRHPEGDFAGVVRSLLEAGSPWNALCYPTGNAPLDELLKPRLIRRPEGAAFLGDQVAVFRLLGKNPGSGEMAQALAGAAKGGHAELCRRLLEAGAPVNGTTDEAQNTPLTYALKSGSPETIAMLKEHGGTAGEALAG